MNVLLKWRAASVVFNFTLRFLWQTLTSSTSKDTEFCSFSEFCDGFSVWKQTNKKNNSVSSKSKFERKKKKTSLNLG